MCVRVGGDRHHVGRQGVCSSSGIACACVFSAGGCGVVCVCAGGSYGCDHTHGHAGVCGGNVCGVCLHVFVCGGGGSAADGGGSVPRVAGGALCTMWVWRLTHRVSRHNEIHRGRMGHGVTRVCSLLVASGIHGSAT